MSLKQAKLDPFLLNRHNHMGWQQMIVITTIAYRKDTLTKSPFRLEYPLIHHSVYFFPLDEDIKGLGRCLRRRRTFVESIRYSRQVYFR